MSNSQIAKKGKIPNNLYKKYKPYKSNFELSSKLILRENQIQDFFFKKKHEPSQISCTQHSAFVTIYRKRIIS